MTIPYYCLAVQSISGQDHQKALGNSMERRRVEVGVVIQVVKGLTAHGHWGTIT